MNAREQNRELNPNGSKLVSKWHDQRSHILTTNYDTLVERIAAEKEYTTANGSKDKLYYTDLYPIHVSSASRAYPIMNNADCSAYIR